MTSITSFYSGQNYALSGGSSGQDKTAATGTILPAATAALLESAQANTGSTDSAYQINLSPQAKAYLARLSESQSAAGSSASSSAGFALNTQQAQQIKDIVSKYKDGPLTQETFDKIQADLRTAGLGPEQLAVKDQMSGFNPTATLIAALDGSAAPAVQQPGDIMAAQQAKAENYIQKVETLWRAVVNEAAGA